MWKIRTEEIQKLCRHAMNEYPKECCGILLGDRQIERVQEIYLASTAKIKFWIV